LLFVSLRLLFVIFGLLYVAFGLLFVTFGLLFLPIRLLFVAFGLLFLPIRLLNWHALFSDNRYVNRFSYEGREQPGAAFKQVPFSIGGLADDRNFVAGKYTVHPFEFRSRAGTQIGVEPDRSLHGYELKGRSDGRCFDLGRLRLDFCVGLLRLGRHNRDPFPGGFGQRISANPGAVFQPVPVAGGVPSVNEDRTPDGDQPNDVGLFAGGGAELCLHGHRHRDRNDIHDYRLFVLLCVQCWCR